MAKKTLSINEIAADLDALDAKDRLKAEKKAKLKDEVKNHKKESLKEASKEDSYLDKHSFSKREERLKQSFKEELKEEKEPIILSKRELKREKRRKAKEKKHENLSTVRLDKIEKELDGGVGEKKAKKKDAATLAKENKLSEMKRKAKLAHAKKKKKQERKLRNGQILRKYLDMAGYEDLNESTVIKRVIQIAIVICALITVGVLIYAATQQTGARAPLIVSLGVWTGILGGVLVLSWVGIYFFLDMRIYNRTMQIEEAFPDYLQLASANISAGMPIDRALWFAVRPRFGVLAKEMETVAKSTLSGEDIPDALRAFANKYDSSMVRRSISLLLEGMDAGGEIASLLNKISINIQETRILKKEMAANVMTYAIFIGFASVAAGPIMYALSGQLLKIIQNIMAMMAESSGGNMSTGMFSLSVTGSSITPADFQIFALVTVFLTSMFSAFIVSSIRKGNVKSGIKSLPVFVGASIILYFIASWVLGKLLGGISAF